MSQYQVVEKFVSINGEGILAGQLAVFIRFKGCNLKCSYCDTSWANEEHAAYSLMTEQEIYRYIKETGVKNVTLTGGEPLLQPNILSLIQVLSDDKNLKIEIETNGSMDLTEYKQLSHPPAITMDYKLPGSRMESNMLLTNFKLLRKQDTVKFVAGSMEDLDCARQIIETHELISKCHVYLSTVFGKISLQEVVEFMKEHTMNEVTLQLQLHKIIWEPDKTGV